MIRTLRNLPIVVLVLLSACVRTGATPAGMRTATPAIPVDTLADRVLPRSADLQLAVDSARRIVRTLRDSLEFPGLAVAVASSDGLIWSEGIGETDLERSLPVTRSSVFPIYSVSKGLTGTALVRLYEEGRIDLDEDVRHYLPWFPVKRSPITVRQLAGHLGGIRHYRPGAGEGTALIHCETAREAVMRFAEDSLIHEPGSAFRYTSFGYVLLSAAMSAAAGETFEEVVRGTVLQPYGLRSTTMREVEIPFQHRVSRYEYRETLGIVPARRMDLSCKLGAGAYFSTAEDIARLAAAMAAGQGLAPTSHDLLLTQQRDAEGGNVPASLGWDVVVDSAGERWLRRTGGNVDAWSAVMASVEGDVAVALLANIRGRDWIHDEAADIARLFIDARQSWPPPRTAEEGAASPMPSRTPPPTLALVGANVLPMDVDTVLTNQVVLISGGRIVEVAPAAETTIPAGTERIDLGGLYLMPGLVDSHTHAGGSALPLYVASGVTTVRMMHGFPARLDRREQQQREPQPWPRVFTAGPLLAGEEVPWEAVIVQGPDEARTAVDAQVAAGYDFVKVYEGLSRQSYDAIVARAREAGLTVAGHVPMDVGVGHVLQAGQQTIEHAEQLLYSTFGRSGVMELPLARVDTVVALFRSYSGHTCLTPTLWGMTLAMRRGTAFTDSLFAGLDWALVDPEVQEWWRSYRVPAPEAARERREHFLRLQQELTRKLHEAGVPILAGTDAPYPLLVPGSSLIREIEALVDTGIPPFDALVAATSNAGRCFGRDQKFGVVRPGARADLLLLDADPRLDLSTLNRPLGVMMDGRPYEADELARFIERVGEDYVRKAAADEREVQE